MPFVRRTVGNTKVTRMHHDPSVANGTFREFRSHIGCTHVWRKNDSVDASGRFLIDGEACARCGAWCRRDSIGRIVDYSTELSRRLDADHKVRKAREAEEAKLAANVTDRAVV
jgi:hypothetical protein